MKKIYLLSVFVMLACSLFAGYLKNVPVTVVQPDGEEISCFATGDEFYHWIHDGNGFTLIRDPQTGVVVYAALQNGELVSANYRAGSIDPASLGLEPWTIIPAEKRTQRRENFLSKMSDIKRGEAPEGSNRNTGTVNNIVIYARFSDEIEFLPKANTYIDMFNKDASNFPSQYAYFKAVSNGKLFVPSTFYPSASGNTILSYQDNYPRSYYQPYSNTNPNGYKNDEEGATRLHQMLRRSIASVSSQIPAGLNIDFNNDGLVDNICFIVRGATDGWSDMLWPHRWALRYAEAISINGKQVWDYNMQLELFLDQVGGSVLVHEMFHTFGAPDLYRYVNNNIDPVGPWDVMNANTTPPQSMTAWMKYKYGGWLNSIPEITQPGTYTLNNVWSESNNAYKIASPSSNTEFFVIEYRDKNVYWDSGLPGSGLIIYRINTLAEGNADGPPDEVYVFRPGGSNNNTNGDIGSAYFSSQTGRTAFSNTTNPPCFLSNNQPGGISISNIGASGGTTMSFEISGSGDCPGPSGMTVNFTPNCDAQITWSAPATINLSVKPEEDYTDEKPVISGNLLMAEDAIVSSARAHGEKPAPVGNDEPENNSAAEGWLRWCGQNYDAIGTNGTAEFIVAARFTVSDLAVVGINTGDVITKMRFVPWHTSYIAAVTLAIYQGGNSPTNPGSLAYQQPVTQTLTQSQYNEIALTTPYSINALQELWIGYYVATYGGYPAGCDAGPRVPDKGDLIYFDNAWTNLYSLTNPPQSANWNIEALITTGGSSQKRYNVYRDGSLIASGILETSYTDKGFSSHENHTWSVKVACDGGGESAPASITKGCNVGIAENEFDNINVYSYLNTVYIKNETNRTVKTVEIFDIMGRIIYQNSGNRSEIAITPAAPGMYAVRLTSQEGKTIVKKVIITQ